MGERAEALTAFCGERGIRLSAAPRLRLVTHMDIRAEHIPVILDSFSAFARA